MALTLKELADGQLPAAKTTLYTVPGATSCLITCILLVNATAGAITVNLYKKKSGGTSRRIIDKDLSIAANGSVRVKGGFTLEAAAVIEGDASAATSVDYVISGVERT